MYFLKTRSFAPFNRFGGGFEGDGSNRKFSISNTVTSRISSSSKINLDSKKFDAVGHTGHSDWFGVPGTNSKAISDVKMSGGEVFKGTQTYYTHTYGKNRAMFWGLFSPDIDVKTSILVSNIIKGKSFDISGVVSGNKFPSNETFITDSNGTSIFLGVSGADGSPYTSLWGEGDKIMSTFKFKVLLNEDDTFKGVEYNNSVYTIDKWNSYFEFLDPKSDQVSTKME